MTVLTRMLLAKEGAHTGLHREGLMKGDNSLSGLNLPSTVSDEGGVTEGSLLRDNAEGGYQRGPGHSCRGTN